MELLLLKEIQDFHRSQPLLVEYPIKVRKIRNRINEISEKEKEKLKQLLYNKQIFESEYKPMRSFYYGLVKKLIDTVTKLW